LPQNQKAGGALSAAVLVVEARGMKKIFQSMTEGSPCEKAECLRSIRAELKELPDTDEIFRDYERHLQLMKDRQRALAEEEMVKQIGLDKESRRAKVKQEKDFFGQSFYQRYLKKLT